MQISRINSLAAVAGAERPDLHSAAAAALAQPPDASTLHTQIAAYQALSRRWRAADDSERAVLAPALTDSAFARRAQATVNAFTRAAWAGADAVPPAPQVQALKAFDNLSGADQEIVAAMHVDRDGKPLFSSAADFRSSLVSAFMGAQALSAPPRQDVVQLSDEARARLAGAASEAWGGAPSPAAVSDPNLAKAIAAYSSGG
jgi:hypothetical protein